MRAEQTKWAALRKALTSKLAASKTFMNKLGAGMTRYAPLCALIAGASACGCMRFYGYNLSFWRYSRHVSEKKEGTGLHFLAHSKHNKFLQGMISCGMCFSLAAAGAYFLCKVCGACLQDDTSNCYEALTEIVRQWDVNKKSVPSVLYDRFERYAQDVKNYGVLIGLDKNDARKLVEAIVAMSVVVEMAA